MRTPYFLFPAVFTCFFALWAAEKEPSPILPGDWTTLQVDNKEDGSISAGADGVHMKRGPMGGKNYFMRAYRDVAVEPATRYLLNYSATVTGSGQAYVFFYFAGPDGKWDDKAVLHSERKGAGEHLGLGFFVNVPPGKVKLRMCLGFGGSNATGVFRDVGFGPIRTTGDLAVPVGTGTVTLDGKLGDPIWQNATRLSSFRVLGKPAQEAALQTEAFLVVKDGMLYLGCRAKESDTSKLKLAAPSNAIDIYQDDCIEIFLSTDRVSYSHLLINGAGKHFWVKKDVGGGRSSWYPVSTASEYQGDWDAAGSVAEGEWACEARIRLSDFFGENPTGDTPLYLNIGRHQARGPEEYTTWTPLVGGTFHNPKDYQEVTLKLPGARESAGPVSVDLPFTSRLTEPELVISGKPLRLTRGVGRVPLPAAVSVMEKGVKADPGVKEFLSRSLAQGPGGKAIVILEISANPFAGETLSVEEQKNLESPEAFRLAASPGHFVLTARNEAALARGVATLALMARGAADRGDGCLPNLVMLDAPRIAFRSWLVHIGKTPQSMRAIIDTAWLLRYNKLFIALDNFSAAAPPFPFKTADIGEVGRTQQEWVEVFEYARARGVEPIPYLASWGRIQYISYKPEYKKINVVDNTEHKSQPYYRNLDVANPEAVKLMLGLQEEMIDVLQPKGFHIAFDEIHFGPLVDSPMAREKKWKNSDWVLEALKAQDTLIQKKKIDCYLWGDMFDPGQNGMNIDVRGPDMLARLPKNWIMMDWKYEGKYDSQSDFPSYDMFTHAGFRTLGCPWYKPFNVARWVKMVYEKKGYGVCQTSWSDTEVDRMKPELSRAVALCGYLAWSPEDTELDHFPFIPDALFKTACARPQGLGPVKNARHLPCPEGVLSGGLLSEKLGFAKGFGLGFLKTPASNYRGVGFQVFAKGSSVAAVYVAGRGGPGEIKNGDFSLGLTGWMRNGSDEEAKFEVVDGALQASRLKPGAFIRVAQDVAIIPGKKYTLSFKMKSSGTANARVWMYAGLGENKWDDKNVAFSTVAGSPDWVVREVPVPHTNTANLRLCLSPEKEGEVCFDEVTLREVGAPSAREPEVMGSASLSIAQKVKTLTFLHSAPAQSIPDSLRMGDVAKRYQGVVAGVYEVSFDDGGVVLIPIGYREKVSGIDDPALGHGNDPVFFGTVGQKQFVNVGSHTWKNPEPARAVKSVRLLPGNSKDMGLALFGLTVE